MLQMLTPFGDEIMRADILSNITYMFLGIYTKVDFIYSLLTIIFYTISFLSLTLSVLCPPPKLRDFPIHVSVSVR